MTTQRLVTMANQVADFFGSYPEAEAIEGTFGHLKSFWDPRMRRALLDWFETGGEGLRPSVLQALKAHRAALAPTG